MLWPKNAPSGAREGRGYIAVVPLQTTVKDGYFVKLAGVWSSAQAAAITTYAGKPGWASANDMLYTVATSGDTWTNPCYPFKRYHFQPESSDTAIDYATSGESVVVFTAGEFETDQYAAAITANMAVGSLLYLDSAGKLTSGQQLQASPSAGRPVAQFLGFNNNSPNSFDSNYMASGMLWFRLLPPFTSVAVATGTVTL